MALVGYNHNHQHLAPCDTGVHTYKYISISLPFCRSLCPRKLAITKLGSICLSLSLSLFPLLSKRIKRRAVVLQDLFTLNLLLLLFNSSFRLMILVRLHRCYCIAVVVVYLFHFLCACYTTTSDGGVWLSRST